MSRLVTRCRVTFTLRRRMQKNMDTPEVALVRGEADDNPWTNFSAVEKMEVFDEEEAKSWICGLQQQSEWDSAWELGSTQTLDPVKVAEA